MAWLDQADIIVLALMLVNTVVIVCQRLWIYTVGRRQSRAFVRDAAAALRDASFDQVMSVASRNDQSHVASIVAVGMTAFASAPKDLTHTEAIDAAERASQRSHNMLSARLRLGLGTLATIASSAPLVGLVGAVFGIVYAFRGGGVEKATWIGMVAGGLAAALMTSAMGLITGISAVWCRNYLCERMEVFDSEMSNAALEAVTYLNAHREWRDHPQGSRVGATGLVFDIPQTAGARSWEVPYDRQRFLLLAIWFGFFYFAFILASGMYWHWVSR
jgi:biopolymer transport protein ExbB/TolQ